MLPKIQIDSLARRILNKCKKEKEYKCLQVPLKESEWRVAYYTELPISEVYECVEYSDDYSTIVNTLGNSDHIAIMVCLRNMYAEKALPKMQNLYEAVHVSRNQNGKKYTASYDKFCHEVSLLGYYYTTLVNGDCMIMEDPKLTFERHHYLKKMQNISKNHVKYYLDERPLGKKFCTRKSDKVQKDYDTEMLFYAISRHGYEKGLFCKKQTVVHDYINWITETLLPDLAPSSVIIINPQSKNKIMTKYHSKKDMLMWLIDHNIPCSDEMHKAELYELIHKSSLNGPQGLVENILKAYGHTVLILPPSLKNFTPTELLWCDFQIRWEKNAPKNAVIAVKTICTYIESVSEKQWSLYEDTVMQQENLIYNIDLDVDKALEYYNVDTTVVM